MFKPKTRSNQKDVTSCRFCGRSSAAAADELAKVKEAAAACLLPASFEPHITLRCIFSGCTRSLDLHRYRRIPCAAQRCLDAAARLATSPQSEPDA
jgi:hypothetical protein